MRNETEFLKLLYPCNYFDKIDCYGILKYKYGVRINKLKKQDYQNKIEDIYNWSREKITQDDYSSLKKNTEFVYNDLLYLLSKEHLFSLYSSLKISKNMKKGGFVRAKLNAIVLQSIGEKKENIQDDWRMRDNMRMYEEIPYIQFLIEPSCMVLLIKTMPYAYIPYSLIKFANENPIAKYLLYQEHTKPDILFEKGIDNLIYDSEKSKCDKRIVYRAQLYDIYGFLYEIIKKCAEDDNSPKDPSCLKWDNIPSRDKFIYLTIARQCFWDRYSTIVKEGYDDSKKIENLTREEVEEYDKWVGEQFLDYIEQTAENNKTINPPQSDISLSNYFDYLSYSQGTFKKIFSHENRDFSINLIDYAATYIINEKIFATYGIVEALSEMSFRKIIKRISDIEEQEYKNYVIKKIAHLLVKLLKIPNPYNQMTILKYLAEKYLNSDMSFEDWFILFEDSVEHFTLHYYPILEIIFHLLVENQYAKLDLNDKKCKTALEGFVSHMNSLTNEKWDKKKEEFSPDEKSIWKEFILEYVNNLEISLTGYPGRQDI